MARNLRVWLAKVSMWVWISLDKLEQLRNGSCRYVSLQCSCPHRFKKIIQPGVIHQQWCTFYERCCRCGVLTGLAKGLKQIGLYTRDSPCFGDGNMKSTLVRPLNFVLPSSVISSEQRKCALQYEKLTATISKQCIAGTCSVGSFEA